jgi:hypothetical protein
MSEEPPKKRGPGRPRKPKPLNPGPKRGPGRPRKVQPEQDAPKSGAGLGVAISQLAAFKKAFGSDERVELTQAQKNLIDASISDVFDVCELAQFVFDDSSLLNSDEEVRAIKRYLIDRNDVKPIENRTLLESISDDEKDYYDFTPEQESLIVEEAQSGSSIVTIAKLVFPGEDNKYYAPLGRACRRILYVLRKNRIDPKTVREGGLLLEYRPSRTKNQAVRKVVLATGSPLEESMLTRNESLGIDKMIRNMATARFVKVMNGYPDATDREIFEQEFVRQTWNKPDLTPEDVNLYILLCKNVTYLETLSSQKTKLNMLIDNLDEDQEYSRNLSDSIKTLDKAYQDCSKSIKDLTKELQGNRQERLKKQNRENVNILNIVEAWKDEKTRREMIAISKKRKQVVAEEVDEFAEMDEFTARILGLRKEDVL